MNKPVIIIGGGGHGKVVADALMAAGRDIIGIVDPHLPAKKRHYLGLQVLGDDRVVDDYSAADVLLVNGIGYMPRNHLRQWIYQQYRQQGYFFASVIHPAAVIGREVVLHQGVQILAGAVVNSGAVLGDNTIINTRAVIEHDSNIGDHCHVAPGAVICGDCTIGQSSFIGAGAVVIQGQQLNNGSLVAAGAVIR